MPMYLYYQTIVRNFIPSISAIFFSRIIFIDLPLKLFKLIRRIYSISHFNQIYSFSHVKYSNKVIHAAEKYSRRLTSSRRSSLSRRLPETVKS